MSGGVGGRHVLGSGYLYSPFRQRLNILCDSIPCQIPFLWYLWTVDTPKQKFCANPDCFLHVASGDPHVEGHGDWATTDDGIVYAREIVRDAFYCHVCAKRLRDEDG